MKVQLICILLRLLDFAVKGFTISLLPEFCDIFLKMHEFAFWDLRFAFCDVLAQRATIIKKAWSFQGDEVAARDKILDRSLKLFSLPIHVETGEL